MIATRASSSRMVYRDVALVPRARQPRRGADLLQGTAFISVSNWYFALLLAIVALEIAPDYAFGQRLESSENTVTVRELWRVGGSEDDEVLFANHLRVGMDSMGKAYVTDRTNPSVYVFSDSGKLLKEIGRAGMGPGEFGEPFGVFIDKRDSLYVWDEGGGYDLLTVFSPREHEYVYSFRPAFESTGSAYFLMGAVPEGLIFRYVTVYFLAETGGLTLESPRFDRVRLVDRDGEWVGEPLDVMPTSEASIIRWPDGGAVISDLPFGRATWGTVSMSGLVYFAFSDSSRITIQSADGRVRRRVSWTHQPVPVTDEDLDHAFRDNSRRFRRAVMKFGVPETKPAFQNIVVDDQERIWVQLSAPYGTPMARHLILDDEGNELGRAEFPVHVRLHVIRGDRAYGVWDDDESAPFIVAYAIQ